MLDLPNHVRQDLVKRIPAALINDIACFVFYDKHPRGNKLFDITVCTKTGEIKEFYQRDLLFSYYLETSKSPVEIRIQRNSKSELFYLIATDEEIFVVNREESTLCKKIENVEKFYIDDSICSGQACLKVITKDDAVPILYDENFNNLGDKDSLFSNDNSHDNVSVLVQLQRKLTEAQYTVKCNEETLKDYTKICQQAALSTYSKLEPNSKDALYHSDNVLGALKVINTTPWVKVCNEKVVLLLHIVNEYKESIENLHFLINASENSSKVYTTKTFTKLDKLPFCKENSSQKVLPDIETAVVCIIDIEEFKTNITARIELSGALSYKVMGKEQNLLFKDVIISSLDVMGDQFDALSKTNDDLNIILSIIATSLRIELCLRHVKNDDEPDISYLDAFCEHLKMERIRDTEMLYYRKSPFHILYGILIVFDDVDVETFASVTVYARSPSQVVALMQLMYNSIPAKIIATTPKHRISSKIPELSQYDETPVLVTEQNLIYKDYASSLLKRTNTVLNYLDNCMIKMCQSKNTEVLNKVGTHIDLFASGLSEFMEFRNKLLDEANKGIASFNTDGTSNKNDIIIDL